MINKVSDLDRLIDVAKRSIGLNEEQSLRLYSAIRQEFRASLLYVGAGKRERNVVIRSDFDGRNIRELSKKYHLTERQIYNIIR